MFLRFWLKSVGHQSEFFQTNMKIQNKCQTKVSFHQNMLMCWKCAQKMELHNVAYIDNDDDSMTMLLTMMMLIKMHCFWNGKFQMICLFTAFVYSCVYACPMLPTWFACLKIKSMTLMWIRTHEWLTSVAIGQCKIKKSTKRKYEMQKTLSKHNH